MEIINYSKKKELKQFLQRPALLSSDLENKVMKILQNVKDKGDKAIRKYNKKYDGFELVNFSVSEKEINKAEKLLPEDLKIAIQQAKNNIEKFHSSQPVAEQMIETMPGVQCWRKTVAIEKVGLYIPGGTAPLFSTILMLGIPARIAGCKEIVLCTPPPAPLSALRRGAGGEVEGEIHPAILYAARLVGVTKIFKVGGAQAIAAMAYGTKTIPQVYKIFGPGNQYVTCAKHLVQKDGIAIDMPAGPSELAVYADETANPSFVAADLLSQAEHGEDSQVMLVLSAVTSVQSYLGEVAEQLKKIPRKEIAKKALKNSIVVLVKDENEAMDLLNQYAPEHLILACRNAEELAEKVINAGSVFLGHYSPETAGDYASGTNHVLPTNGYAKTHSGISVDSFVRKITFQKLNEQGLKNIGNTVELLAEAEGLHAHKNAISIRINNQ